MERNKEETWQGGGQTEAWKGAVLAVAEPLISNIIGKYHFWPSSAFLGPFR